MRRLVWLLCVAALAWSLWWAFAAFSMRDGLVRWFDDRRAEGWQADYAAVTLRGYPTLIDIGLDAPLLADPDTGVAVGAPQMQLTAPVWWPGYLKLKLPQDRLTVATLNNRRDISADAPIAELRLRPGAALELERLSIDAGPWRITGEAGTFWRADGLSLRLVQDEADSTLYRVSSDAPRFAPGGVTRANLRIPQDWPITFDALTVQGMVRFDRALDRRTIEVARPRPRRIQLDQAEALWGELRIRVAADLDVSDDGRASGDMSIQARNWREMLNLAEASGVLPASLRTQVETILQALARGSGNAEALDLTLTLDDGQVFLGFVPLGPAPRLLLP